MVNRAAAGGPAHHMDFVGFHEGAVDLSFRVLVLPDHDGVFILPEEQIIAGCPPLEDNFLKRQIVIRISGTCLQIEHIGLAFLPNVRFSNSKRANGHMVSWSYHLTTL